MSSSLSESSGSEFSGSSLSESSRSDSSVTSESFSSLSSPSDNHSSSSSDSSSSSSSSTESSSSSSSESSLSDTSSSWSSESSEWDHDWYSILYRPAPEVCDYRFVAWCEIDLRRSDAVVVQRLGPLRVQFGGTFGTDTFLSEIVGVLDGYRNTKVFSTLAAALAWQDAVEQRIRHALMELRLVFNTQYPGEYAERHRRI